jgi:hypothetical protein
MQTLSVEPAADFGSGHGQLVVSESGEPEKVIIHQADRVVYILEEWMERAAAGEFPWAEVVVLYPWSAADVFKVRGADRTVVYQNVGGCGPRVMAGLWRQPD